MCRSIRSNRRPASRIHDWGVGGHILRTATLQLQLSRRQIARALSLSRAGVRVTIERATAAGLTWPLPEAMTDTELESHLYPPAETGSARPRRPEPDWEKVRSELSRKHVTRDQRQALFLFPSCLTRKCYPNDALVSFIFSVV